MKLTIERNILGDWTAETVGAVRSQPCDDRRAAMHSLAQQLEYKAREIRADADRCGVVWRAGLVVPPGETRVDGARCTLPYGHEGDHDAKARERT